MRNASYTPTRVALTSCFALLASTQFALAEEEIDASSLLNLSLAELGDIEITSVSKKAEKASEAAAAIFVLTNEDIKRSGATNIPEALRGVPGLQVSQSASHQWAVSARGFNGQFANKLLVLIDGRSVYTPIFSGVLWDIQDTLLEDIERIEVIRGPGATLWGSNAVNGVINIITKSSKDTTGNYAKVAVGNFDRAAFEFRHGGELENGNYRVYGKHNLRDGLDNADDGSNLADSSRKTQGGFRTDLDLENGDNLTVQGDVYHLVEQVQFDLPSFTAPALTTPSFDNAQAQGLNVLARWGHQVSEDSNFTLQTYYDYTTRDVIYYRDSIHTADIDFQYEYRGFDRQEIIWGLGYRLIYNNTDDAPFQTFTPENRTDNLFSGFIQDEIELVEDEFFFTIGSKFEHNDYSGFEVQPSARFAWLLGDGHTFWGSVSRAVNTPYRFTDDSQLILAGNTTPAPGFLVSQGNRDLESEDLIAYELGYRVKPTKNTSLDIAAFYNDYDNLFNSVVGTPALTTDPIFGAFLAIPLSVVNSREATSYGVEVSGNADLADNWQVSANYSYLNLQVDEFTTGTFVIAGQQPRHQFNARSTYLFPYGIEMTNSLYYVGALSGADIDDYVRFDTRLSWQAHDNLELNLVGQNLFGGDHQEFSSFLFQRPAEIGQTVYGSAVFKF